MKRSPRHGWTLIELRDGRWHVVTTGDREQLKGAFAARVSKINGAPGDGLTLAQRYAGNAAALYDAHGQRRDQYPSLPRLADGTRLLWPTTLPSDGEEPVERPQREPAP